MKIAILQTAINEYYQSNWFWRSWQGSGKVFAALNRLLESYETQDQSAELPYEAEFALIELLQANPYPELDSIRAEFSKGNSLNLYLLIKKIGIADASTYIEIKTNAYHNFIINLLNSGNKVFADKNLYQSQVIFIQKMLAFPHSLLISDETLETVFRSAGRLTPSTLQVLFKHLLQSEYLIAILQLLHSHQLFKEEYIALLAQSDNLHLLELNLVNILPIYPPQDQIRVYRDLACHASQASIHRFLEQYPYPPLYEFKYLLNLGAVQIQLYMRIKQLIHALSLELMPWLEWMNSPELLADATLGLKMLTAISVEDRDKKQWDAFLLKLNCSQAIRQVAQFLKDFQSKEGLKLLIELSELRAELGPSITISRALLKDHVPLEQKHLDRMKALSNKRFLQFAEKLVDLSLSRLLTIQSFQEALSRIDYHLGKSLLLDAERIKIKAQGDRAGIRVGSNQFFYEDQSREINYVGGTGVVEKLYQETEQGKTYFALKKMRPTPSRPINLSEMSLREVKYHRFFDRTAFAITSDQQVAVIMPWIEGRCLDKINARCMSGYDEILRITALLSLLEDLQKLHLIGRLHGDLKPGNVIFNLETQKLHLIDFGTTLRESSKKWVGLTPGLFDSRGSVFPAKKLPQDIYSLLHIIKQLFPEIGLELNQGPSANPSSPVTLQSDNQSPSWALMRQFTTDCLLNPLGDARLTIHDLIEFFTILKQEFSSMTARKAEGILKDFKSDSLFNSEAVLCGRTKRL